MPNTETTTTTLDPAGPEALAKAQAHAAAIPDAELIPIRVDVADAALGAIGVMPTLEAHRAAIERTFGAEGTQALADLVPAARAAMLAQAGYTASAEQDLEPLAASLTEKRVRLFTVAMAAIERGAIKSKALAKLEGGQGYVPLVVDTLALVHFFRANDAALAPHSKVTAAELSETQAEAEAFGRLLKERDQARAGSAPAAKERARAFTHFVRTYDRVRKLVTFVRWHEGDASQIAPSLYAGRSRAPESPSTEPVRPV